MQRHSLTRWRRQFRIPRTDCKGRRWAAVCCPECFAIACAPARHKTRQRTRGYTRMCDANSELPISIHTRHIYGLTMSAVSKPGATSLAAAEKILVKEFPCCQLRAKSMVAAATAAREWLVPTWSAGKAGKMDWLLPPEGIFDDPSARRQLPKALLRHRPMP